jgi:hypothetical protein
MCGGRLKWLDDDVYWCPRIARTPHVVTVAVHARGLGGILVALTALVKKNYFLSNLTYCGPETYGAT